MKFNEKQMTAVVAGLRLLQTSLTLEHNDKEAGKPLATGLHTDIHGDEIEALCEKILAMSTHCAVPVAYWDSQAYGTRMSEPDRGKSFNMEIIDQRESNGQLYIDVSTAEGHLDDVMSATFEINRLPGSGDDVQCMHLHFDGDNLAASFFKQGDRYIIRPETEVTLRATTLPNGERAWIME